MGRLRLDRTVANLLCKYGGIGTLKVYSDGVYNDGELSSITETDYIVNIAIFDYPQSMAGDKSGFGTLILEGDKQCYMRPVSKADPTTDEPIIKANRDLIKIGSTTYKILTLKELNSTGADVICYELHLRK